MKARALACAALVIGAATGFAPTGLAESPCGQGPSGVCEPAEGAELAQRALARLARSLSAPPSPLSLLSDPDAVADRSRAALVLARLAIAGSGPVGTSPGFDPPAVKPLSPQSGEPLTSQNEGKGSLAAIIPLPPPSPVPPRQAAPTVLRQAAVARPHVEPPVPPRSVAPDTSRRAGDDRRVPPVAGPVVSRFGAAPSGGGPLRGIAYRAKAGDTVRAPAAGHIVFAGPFRGYGLLLIVEHADGYHTLLTGFGRIDTHIGRRVDAGDPLGVAKGAEGSASRVHLELRKDGRTVDPKPWLTSKIRKVAE